MTSVVPVEVLEAQDVEYRADLAKLEMQIVVYRKALLDHGIEPPDKTGEELLKMWRDCSRVISTASEFVATLGSAKEMLNDSWR